MVPRLGVNPPDLPKGSTYTLHRDVQHPACLTFSVPSIALHSGSGLLTRFPSATAFALTLGADSPCADERCAGNLGLSASMPFTCFIATHVSIRTSDTSRAPRENPFIGLRNAPLPFEPKRFESAASVRGLSPDTSSAQDGLASRPVSCYAFFKGWLLLSQPPGCLCLPTSFTT